MERDMAFGSGNVFADLGLPDAEERLAKADLASKIASVLEARGLSQMEAARITGVPQPKISLLTRGRLGEFSTDRLCRILNSLGVSVALVLAEEEGWATGRTTVLDASDVPPNGDMSHDPDGEEQAAAMAM